MRGRAPGSDRGDDARGTSRDVLEEDLDVQRQRSSHGRLVVPYLPPQGAFAPVRAGAKVPHGGKTRSAEHDTVGTKPLPILGDGCGEALLRATKVLNGR